MTEKKKPSAQRKAPAQRAPVEHTPSGEAPAPLETHPLLDDAPIALAADTKPMRIGSADAVLLVCPTCGTTKTANRCEVCGHQEHDT